MSKKRIMLVTGIALGLFGLASVGILVVALYQWSLTGHTDIHFDGNGVVVMAHVCISAFSLMFATFLISEGTDG